MEPTGFFAIHIGDPEQEHVPKVEPPASSPEPDEAGVAGSGYSVHLGWMQGVPYLTDLGSAGKILVNATPIEPNWPVVIRAGDSITIGNIHLTWNAGTGADQPSHDREATAVPEEAVELPGREIPAEPASPSDKSDRLASVEAADATLHGPKQPAEQIRAEPPDPTLITPKRAAKPPAPETPDPTLLAPKRATKPPAPETPDDKAVAPDEAAKIHRRLLPLINALFVVSSPIPVKYAINHIGFRVGKPRLPLTEPDEKSAAFIRDTLKNYQIDLPV